MYSLSRTLVPKLLAACQCVQIWGREHWRRGAVLPPPPPHPRLPGVNFEPWQYHKWMEILECSLGSTRANVKTKKWTERLTLIKIFLALLCSAPSNLLTTNKNVSPFMQKRTWVRVMVLTHLNTHLYHSFPQSSLDNTGSHCLHYTFH